MQISLQLLCLSTNIKGMKSRQVIVETVEMRTERIALPLILLSLTIFSHVSISWAQSNSNVTSNNNGTSDWFVDLGYNFGNWLKEMRNNRTNNSTFETDEEFSKNRAKDVQNYVEENRDAIAIAGDYLISSLSTIGNGLSNVRSFSQRIENMVSSIAEGAAGALSYPEIMLIRLMGSGASTIVEIIGHLLDNLPLIGDRIYRVSDTASQCVSYATYNISNSIPSSMISCVLSPAMNVADTVIDVTANLDNIISVISTMISDASETEGMVNKAINVFRDASGNITSLWPLIYNLVTGLSLIVSSFGGMVPCFVTSVPATVLLNIYHILLNMFRCMLEL